MNLLLKHNSNKFPTHYLIRDGRSGNFEIVLRMIELVRETNLTDRGFERWVKQLYVDAGLDHYSTTQQKFELIYNWVKTNVVYLQDVAGKIESIKSARETLSDGFGDCDDISVLIASMLAVLGYESKFVLARYVNERTDFQHVYVAQYVGKNRYVLDGTLLDGELGQEIKNEEIVEVGIFDTVKELQGIASLFRNTRQTAKNLGGTVLRESGTILGSLPFGLGYISNQVISSGINLIADSRKTDLSLNETTSKINRKLDNIISRLEFCEIALDFAQLEANRSAVEIMLFQDQPNFETAKKSIQQRLNYINNYKKLGNTDTVELDGKLMLLLGVSAIGVSVGYYLKKRG